MACTYSLDPESTDFCDKSYCGLRNCTPYFRLDDWLVVVQVGNLKIAMAQRKRWLQTQLGVPLEDSERMPKPRPAALAPPSTDETYRPTKGKENTLYCEVMVRRLLEETSVEKDSNRKSPEEKQKTSKLMLESPVEQGKVREMVEYAINNLTIKLKTRAVHVTKKISWTLWIRWKSVTKRRLSEEHLDVGLVR